MIETMKQALEAAYLSGFNASGEGYNGEYPFGDKKECPSENRVWKKDRDNYVRQTIAQAKMVWIGLTDEECQWIYDNGRTPSGMMEMVGAMKLALEALEANLGNWAAKTKAIPIIKQAIVEAEMVQRAEEAFESAKQREWVGLTDDERYAAIRPLYKTAALTVAAFSVSKDEYRAIEAALKEKNT